MICQADNMQNILYSETCIKRPHVGKRYLYYYRGGLSKGVKIYAMTDVEMWSVKKDRFYCIT